MSASSLGTVVVTRPEREAAAWVDALRAQGLPAQALPLIVIDVAPDPAALAVFRARLADYAAAMFVSANAVHGFFAVDGPPWPAGTRAWATGPGTSRAILAAGVPPAQVDAPAADAAQFDSEALWARVHDRLAPADRVLIVRGGDEAGRAAGRDWLAGRIEQAGGQFDTAVAYLRRLPVWGDDQFARARAGAAPGSWWLFSSSEAVDNLHRLLPGQDWSDAGALCTHPRIAQAAIARGFGQVAQAQPSAQAVAAFLQSVA